MKKIEIIEYLVIFKTQDRQFPAAQARDGGKVWEWPGFTYLSSGLDGESGLGSRRGAGRPKVSVALLHPTS